MRTSKGPPLAASVAESLNRLSVMTTAVAAVTSTSDDGSVSHTPSKPDRYVTLGTERATNAS